MEPALALKKLMKLNLAILKHAVKAALRLTLVNERR